MPPEPTPSDIAFLRKAGEAIRIAHDLGIKFAIIAAANSIGNNTSSRYAFEERPYYVCEEHVDPKDKGAASAFLDGRRRQLEPIAHADAFVVIDSDPGGYPGATAEEFAAITKDQLGVFRGFNPDAAFYCWLWFGWRNQCRFLDAVERGEDNPIHYYFEGQADAVAEELDLLKDRIEQPWGVFASLPSHMEPTEWLGLAAKRLFFPCALVEGGPSFPLTNYFAEAIEKRFGEFAYCAERFPHGAMANAQTHCLQLPNTYLFAHYAMGGTRNSIDLAGFAEQLVPGCGETIARARELIECGEPQEQRAAARDVRNELCKEYSQDPSGLLFGSPERFLTDLAINLEVRAAMADFEAAMDAETDVLPTLRAFVAHLRLISSGSASPMPMAARCTLGLTRESPGSAIQGSTRRWRVSATGSIPNAAPSRCPS